MVQTLATLVMTYKQHPSLSDCGTVAKSLVSRFPFLTDSEETGEVCFTMSKLSIFDIYIYLSMYLSIYLFIYIFFLQYSWKWFIYNRAQNLNKTSKRAKVIDVPTSSKRQRLSNGDRHFYPAQIPGSADDDESQARNCSRLSEELAKAKPSSEVLKELMSRTYPKRRVWITKASPPPSLTEVMSDFPLLKRSSYVSFIYLEFILLFII